ncbi:hypothetical protein CL619_02825 [archaeon]|nr:hypothetical protein [archaeon]
MLASGGIILVLEQILYSTQDRKIKYFGNGREVPKKLRDFYYHHHFRLAFKDLGLSKKPKYRIVLFINPERAEKKAIETLLLTIREYNKKYGFKLPIKEKVQSLFWS